MCQDSYLYIVCDCTCVRGSVHGSGCAVNGGILSTICIIIKEVSYPAAHSHVALLITAYFAQQQVHMIETSFH